MNELSGRFLDDFIDNAALWPLVWDEVVERVCQFCDLSEVGIEEEFDIVIWPISIIQYEPC